MTLNYNSNSGSMTMIFVLVTGLIVSLAVIAIMTASRKVSSEANMLRSLITTQAIIEQLAVESLQAYRTFNNHQANPTTTGNCPPEAPAFKPGFNNRAGFCFPASICVEDPGYAQALCIDTDTPDTDDDIFEIIDVLPGNTTVHNNVFPKKKSFKEVVHNFLNRFVYFDSEIHAQSILNENFAIPAPTPQTLDETCTGTLCKTCSETPDTLSTATPQPTGNEVVCIRVRVCPRYGGCDFASNLDWVVQSIGMIVSPPDPGI